MCVCVLREGKMVDAPVVVRSPQIHTHTPGIFFFFFFWVLWCGKRPATWPSFLILPSRASSILFYPPQTKEGVFFSSSWAGEEGTFTLLSCSIYIFSSTDQKPTMFGVGQMKKDMAKKMVRQFPPFLPPPVTCETFLYLTILKTKMENSLLDNWRSSPSVGQSLAGPKGKSVPRSNLLLIFFPVNPLIFYWPFYFLL